MTIVTQTPTQMPSILEMVKRVKRECGLPEPTTLVGTTDKQALIALDALNDAANDIFGRKRWEWQESLFGLQLQSGVVQYNLPADFQRMSKDPIVNGVTVKPMDPVDFYSLPTGALGSPLNYTVHGYIFELWPAPSVDYVAAYPILPYVYFRETPARLTTVDDSANLNLPPVFLECLIAFGKWKLKAFLEYPDAERDHQRYEDTLFLRMNVDRTLRTSPRMRMPATGRKSWC